MKPNNIVVKTEHQVESILGIKREKNTENKETIEETSSSNSQSNTKTWVQEKQSMIEKIVSLKSENQHLISDLMKAQDESKTMADKNRLLMKNLSESDKNYTDQLTAAQKHNDEYLKRNKELIRERDLLRAQFKQLQNGFARQKTSKDDDDSHDNDDEQYEVERLLDDKLIQTRQFFVRWKNYDSSHDSWVYEKDLNCPRLLRKYDQLKKK